MERLLATAALAPDRKGVLLICRGGHEQLRRKLRDLEPPVPYRLHHGDLLVQFEQAARLLDAPFLDWHPETRVAIEKRAAVAAAAPDVRRRAYEIARGDAAAARANLRDSRLVDKLDDHQALNVAALTVPGCWGGCIFDEQGTGKTITMVAIFDVLVERNLADTMIVVAPKSMLNEWANAFARFTGDVYKVRVADGTRREKLSAFSSGADVVVVNYETALSMEQHLRLLARRSRVVLAVDESFNVKNREAQRTTAVTAIREWCSYAFVLCGTPAPNSAKDLIAQFDLVDLGYTFRNLRLDPDPDRMTEQVRNAIHARGLYVRNLKSVVLGELPDRSFDEVHVEMAPIQGAAYVAALQGLIDDLKNIGEAAFRRDYRTFLARRAALLRLCSDPAGILLNYDEIPAKVAALDRLIDHYVKEQGEKIVLWSFYRTSLDRLAARYAPLGLVRVDGGVTEASARQEAVRRFQEDDDTMVFLGNPAAAGAGLTLHRARIAIYESLSNQAAHFLQSLDRIHRRGQQRPVRYVTLLCQDSLELIEYERLREKARRQGDLLGDPPDRPATRLVLLDELVAAQSMLEQRVEP